MSRSTTDVGGASPVLLQIWQRHHSRSVPSARAVQVQHMDDGVLLLACKDLFTFMRASQDKVRAPSVDSHTARAASLVPCRAVPCMRLAAPSVAAADGGSPALDRAGRFWALAGTRPRVPTVALLPRDIPGARPMRLPSTYRYGRLSKRRCSRVLCAPLGQRRALPCKRRHRACTAQLWNVQSRGTLLGANHGLAHWQEHPAPQRPRLLRQARRLRSAVGSTSTAALHETDAIHVSRGRRLTARPLMPPAPVASPADARAALVLLTRARLFHRVAPPHRGCV